MLAYLFAAIGGAITYRFYFHQGEHHLYPQNYVLLVLFLTITANVGIQHKQVQAPYLVISLIATYLSGIYIALISYRMLLNPLNKLPGRWLARLTAFDHVFNVCKERDMYLKLYDQHQRYGKFVRIGPNDVSVADANVIHVALGPSSKCIKAPWYSIEHPGYSLHTTRKRSEHDKRRRIWSPAFSDKALRGYENRVARYNQLLIEQLDSSAGQAIDMSKWFNLWSFDVMGDLAFGDSFQMLETASSHWAISLLNSAQDPAGWALPPWVGRLLWTIPGARIPYQRFLKFCAEQIENRMALQGKQTNPDITNFLIEKFNASSPEEKKSALPMLHLDSKLIIVAGSDTTAATLTFMFYHLASEPGLIARLRKEIDPLVTGDHIEHQQIQGALLLNGCINETLRLHPPVPSGLYRKAPPEGVQIGEQYIPGNTVLQIHLYSMGRDEDNFAQATQFIPERFFSRPELVKHKDAFAPFSSGPFNCIGKNLAYMEIRLLAAQIITRFDVSLGPGEDGTNLLYKSKDHFTIGLAPLNLVFTRRT